MTCPNCNHLNPEGILFCQKCNSFLPDSVSTEPETAVAKPEPPPPTRRVKALPAKPVPATLPVLAALPSLPPPPAPWPPVAAAPLLPPPAPAVSDSPFGDFLPAWINPGEPKPPSTRQSRPVAAAPAAPISIDNLLQETAKPNPASLTSPVMVETATATATPNPQPAFTSNRPEPAPMDPWQGLPVPAFQMPPLWFKPPTEIGWQEVKKAEEARAIPSTTITNGYNPTLVGPETRDSDAAEPVGPEYGVDRGFYFFTDRHGNVTVHALAGFVRRLAGAVVDSVVSFVIALITVFTVSFAFADMPFTRQNVLNYYLILIGLVYFFTFLYHAFLVGLTGQSLGHRALKIKVIRREGRAVGLISGIVRALYGLVPYLINLVISLLLPTPATGVNPVVTILSIATVSLTGLGMAWALFDKGHQGLHDKLADTYVVSASES